MVYFGDENQIIGATSKTYPQSKWQDSRNLILHHEWIKVFVQRVGLSIVGLPKDDDVKWTYLNANQIVE